MSEPHRLSPAAERLLKKARVMATSEDVASPCVSVCRVSSASQLCEGCWRTLDEIAMWSSCAIEEKRRIWAQLAQRIRQLPSP